MGSSSPALPQANRSKYRQQNAPKAPFCRVHVYSANHQEMEKGNYFTSAMAVKHWAGLAGLKARNWTLAEIPHTILGREGVNKKTDASKAVITDPHRWSILNARVVLTRHWNCSSFNFQIAHPVDPCVVIHKYMTPPIKPNDVVVIEMGYTQAMAASVTKANGQTDWFHPTLNPGGRAHGDVVFVGVVDTIQERAGSGEADGIVFTVKGRDQVRWLADQKFRAHYAPTTTQDLNRAYVIRDLLYHSTMIDEVKFASAQDATTANFGDDQGSSTAFNQRSNVDPVTGRVTIRTPDTAGPQSAEGTGGQPGTGPPIPATPGANNSYIRLGMIEFSSRVDKPPTNADGKNETPVQMLIMDKFPLAVIKHYSLVETAPRELWADPRTGNIHWMNRRTDARRLYSPNKEVASTRQYYYRFPQSRANIQSATNEWSVAGVVTHFTICNPMTGQGDAGMTQIFAESPTATLRDPHTGGYLRPMTRNRFVYDDTLTEGSDVAVSILGALFHIWGRAIQTGMVMIEGDPTLEIGEAVQLFNMGFFSRRSHTDGVAAGTVGQTDATDEENYTDLLTNPEGIHRVEAVQHLFAVGGVHRGYSTVFVYGPVDEDTGQAGGGFAENGQLDAASAPRFIRTDADFNRIAEGCLSGLALTTVNAINEDTAPPLNQSGQPSNGTEPPKEPAKEEEKKPAATAGTPANPTPGAPPKSTAPVAPAPVERPRPAPGFPVRPAGSQP